jgi:hypothetical protein
MVYFKEDRKSQSVLCRNCGIGVLELCGGVVCALETTILVLLLLFLLLFFITVIYYNDYCTWKVFDLSHIMYNYLWM